MRCVLLIEINNGSLPDNFGEVERLVRQAMQEVSAEIRENIESALNNLSDALKSEDGDRIKRSIDHVMQASQKLGEEVYKATAQQQGAAAAGAGPQAAPEAQSDRGTTEAGAKKDEDVIDAEYEVKDNK
jgi:molecular chaperone DnaK